VTTSVWLADLTWPEVSGCAAQGAILAVPVGATEQHGPHIPLSTDTDIAIALCTRLAAACEDVLIAPPVAYGSSGEHAGFAGTLSIGQEATELLLIELGRSASETFSRLLFVSAHGGNNGAVTRAASQLRGAGRDVLVFEPHWAGHPHAGRPETSMQLAIDPSRVRMDEAAPGNVEPLSVLMPALQRSGVRGVSANGVLGDPTGANADEGHALLASLAAQLVDQVRSWRTAVRVGDA
jgi:mycofactocin system creatininase family protein